MNAAANVIPWWRVPSWRDTTRFWEGKVRQATATGKAKFNVATRKLGRSNSTNVPTRYCCICNPICFGNGPSYFQVALVSLTLPVGCFTGSDGNDYQLSGPGSFTLKNIGHFEAAAAGCQWVRNVPLSETPWTCTHYTTTIFNQGTCANVTVPQPTFYLRTVITLNASIGTTLLVTMRYGAISIASPQDPIPVSTAFTVFNGQGGAFGCITSSTIPTNSITTPVAWGGSAVVSRCAP